MPIEIVLLIPMPLNTDQRRSILLNMSQFLSMLIIVDQFGLNDTGFLLALGIAQRRPVSIAYDSILNKTSHLCQLHNTNYFFYWIEML